MSLVSCPCISMVRITACVSPHVNPPLHWATLLPWAASFEAAALCRGSYEVVSECCSTLLPWAASFEAAALCRGSYEVVSECCSVIHSEWIGETTTPLYHGARIWQHRRQCLHRYREIRVCLISDGSVYSRKHTAPDRFIPCKWMPLEGQEPLPSSLAYHF